MFCEVLLNDSFGPSPTKWRKQYTFRITCSYTIVPPLYCPILDCHDVLQQFAVCWLWKMCQKVASSGIVTLHKKKSSCLHLLMYPCQEVPFSLCSHSLMSQCPHVPMSSCPKWPNVPMSQCPHVPISSCLNVLISQCHQVPMSSCPNVITS